VYNFYEKYIKIPEGHQLETIIARFEKITNIPYMWGAIDGSHIVLAKKPNAKEVLDDYYNRHHSHSILFKGFVTINGNFWMYVCNLFVVVMMQHISGCLQFGTRCIMMNYLTNFNSNLIMNKIQLYNPIY
jgi:hypothetical protein